MKRLISILLLISSITLNLNAEKAFYGGLEVDTLNFGLSGKVDLTDKFTLQGTLGFFGDLQHYGAKAIYKIDKKKAYNMFAYTAVGIWKWEGVLEEDESIVGYSAGGGLELDLQQIFGRDFPPLFMSGEIGFDAIDFDYVDYGGLHIGGGIHYKF
jgi:hypothetical protein